MRYLGIDYGTKRTGIAVSDEEGRLAFPRSVIGTSPSLVPDLVSVLLRESVSTIILGRSVDRTGAPNPVMKHIELLKKDLEGRGYTVLYEDERYSSLQASREGGEGDLHDASTAAVILQGFLDRHQPRTEYQDPYTPLSS